MAFSTKQYPTSFVTSPEMEHLKADPWRDFLRQFSKGVLTMAHMDGADTFPWSRPCGGGFSGTAQLSPL